MAKIIGFNKKPIYYVIVFNIITILIIIAGYNYYKFVQNKNKEDAYANIATLAKLKINEVVHWRKERISDARFIYKSTALKHLINTYLHTGNKIIKQEIIDWLSPIIENPEYVNILIIENSGKIHSLFKTADGLNERDKIFCSQSVKEKEIVLGGLHKNSSNEISLGNFIPLFHPAINNGNVFAVLEIKINARKILYPLIEFTPINSTTAETFIVRREGDSVLFLNDLKFVKNSAVSFKLPLNIENLPAAMVVKGMKGIYEGKDYTGKEVLSDINQIPDSPWFIVSKINLDEIYAPVREQAIYIISVVIALIIICGVIIYSSWRNQKVKWYDQWFKLEQERKIAEEEVRKLSRAVEQSPVSVVITDLTGRIEYANPKFTEVTGYRLAEALGKNPRILKSGLTPDYIYKQLWETLLKGSLWKGEFSNRKKNGEVYWEHASISPIKNEEGVVTHYVAVKEDITHRKQAETALLESRKDLNRAQAVAKTGSWRLNVKQNELLWSDETYRIFGIPKGTPMNYESFLNAVYSDDRDYVSSRWTAALSGESYEIEHRILAEGKIKWVKEKAELEFDNDGNLFGGFGTVQDITERKKIEEELRIQQQKLEAAVYELKRSNKDLEQFAYTASHDLQEPIRMIKSYAQLLDKKYKAVLDTNAREFLDFIIEGAARMQQLVNDLLKYSRITTTKHDFENVDCNTVLKDVLDDLKFRILEEDVLIKIDELPVVKGDRTQLRQLFQNFIQNAIKFRSERRPEIKIGCIIKDNKWLFSIRDNGIGIDEKFFDRIFVLFQRLHDREKYSGTGLGLAICKKIVEQHGGEVCLDSEIEKGTTFYFTLPI